MESHNYMELEDMRSQLAAFKKKLDNQEIVNDRLLRRAISKNLSGIHRVRNTFLVLGVFAIYINIHYCLMFNLSYWFMGYAMLIIAYEIYNTLKYHKNIEDININNADLLTTVKELKTLKSRYNHAFLNSAPLLAIFIGWMLYEVNLNYGAHFTKHYIIMVGIGIIIGGALGLMLNRKVVRACNEIIKDIEE